MEGEAPGIGALFPQVSSPRFFFFRPATDIMRSWVPDSCVILETILTIRGTQKEHVLEQSPQQHKYVFFWGGGGEQHI